MDGRGYSHVTPMGVGVFNDADIVGNPQRVGVMVAHRV